MRLRRLVLPVAVALLVIGCSDSEEGGSSTEVTQPAATEPAGTDPADETSGEGTSSSCTADYRTMSVAVETFVAINGVAPSTEQELVDAELLRTQFDTFDLMSDGSAVVVIAAPGGSCDGVDLDLSDDEAPVTAGPPDGESACEVERKVLETALEAYLANGGSMPVTEADLVTAGFLRVEFEDYDIDGELVVPVGDRCADA